MNWATIVATGFYTGFIKPAPGTWGSLAALGLVFLVESTMSDVHIAIGFLFLFSVTVGTLAVRKYIKGSSSHDPSEVVIDEWAGQFLTFVLVPVTPVTLIAGFILFRLFDIWKIGPIGRLEKLPGEWGIMADDIAAGAFAAVCLWAINYLLTRFPV